MNNLNWITYLIVIFGVINLLRMSLFLIGSDWYSLVMAWQRKKRHKKNYQPSFSVVIPAHNERKTILRCVKSVLKNDYPQDKLEVIVIDDGSTDSTAQLVKNLKRKNRIKNLKIISQKNAGKARALNKGMRQYAKGELVMCLDADSYLAPDAVSKAVFYFQDKKVMALSANVKIIDRPTLLNLIQKYEYLVCYQMKRAQTLFNIEYIIGGIGSTFRRTVLEKVNYYDTNTVTEDIDITMKILQRGNKNNRVIYGADVIAWTESVLSFSGLIRQRYRWKWGRCQTFLKNKSMFFNSKNKFTKGLTFLYLPFGLYGDFAFLFEPLMVSFILCLSFIYHDPATIVSAFVVITGYMMFNIWAEDTFSVKEKIKLSLIAPTMYFYFYILSLGEYIALVKSLINIKNLPKSLGEGICGWQHVERISYN